MSADGSNNNNTNGGGNGDANPRNRRSSITQAALSNLFQRGPPNSTSGPPFPGQPSPAVTDPQRRRLSVTTLGLSGASSNGASALGIRRGSMSTNSNNSDSIDESAIEDDDMAAKTAPNTPFTRRMSFGGSAMRGYRPGGGSPGNGNNPTSPPPHPTRRPSNKRGSMAQMQGPSISAAIAGRRASIGIPASSFPQASNTTHPRNPSDNPSRLDQQGFNWSEQLRSRAESNMTGGHRPSFSMAGGSPPRSAAPIHDRAKSVSDLPAPPVQAPAVKPPQERQKPDAFQERILKGDFYMD